MSNHKDVEKYRRNDLLKNLPSEVLLKARSTLVSLGALKPKERQKKQETKNKNNSERLKSSRSEPEFREIRKVNHRSRVDEPYVGGRPRPLSVGATKRFDEDVYWNYDPPEDASPLHRRYESNAEMCLQSRLVFPSFERLNHELHTQDVNERPRKKLSFREPEIVGGCAGASRSSKLMGVNSLSRRPDRVSIRSEPDPNIEMIESDLQSQAMRIVRTVGQAFDVCHKIQDNSPEHPVASTSSAGDEHAAATTTKAPVSECSASDTGGPSSSKATEEITVAIKPKLSVELPPPKKDEKRRISQAVPSINLPDLPECVIKMEKCPSPVPEGAGLGPLSAQHQLQLLKERLEQQAQQTQAAVAQLQLLRDQLAAEQAARCEAQSRTHQLITHNKELLEHIAALVSHLQDREKVSPQPISAQQLTLLPQAKSRESSDAHNHGSAASNGNLTPLSQGGVTFMARNNKGVEQNVENNNNIISSPTSSGEKVSRPSSSPSFSNMTNEQIQNYLITKFEDMTFSKDDNTSCQQYYQNSNAFPNIPPIVNNYSNSDLESLLNQYKMNSSPEELGAAQAMSIGHSQSSLYSQPSSSPDSSSSDEADGVPFILPLSHGATLATTGHDGRVRLVVPVTPSESSSNVADSTEPSGPSLTVPDAGHLAPGAPITRSTSEKLPHRSEMMLALRSQWTRHTTK
ncbi:capon-like protein isoform X1 [Leptidea sinapis]|uniref:capon-like protein isoform X1 n=1 Tax=Leptidea sinapis TaxID=189913 RepID=UPI0021410953|nr:capon-like protein isoform X1 [Leptidea sinapis]